MTDWFLSVNSHEEDRDVCAGGSDIVPARAVTASARLSLPVDRVDLWLASCADLDDSQCQRCRALLTADERHRELRFHFIRDRRRYVVTRALVRVVLSRYAPPSPSAWRFLENRYGRPGIVNGGEIERALSFNLSHAADLILLAVTCRRSVGVDIEAVRERLISMGVAERFFSSSEIDALQAMPLEARTERFFALWTLKEAYVKARAMGLAIPLDSFAFDISAGPCIGLSLSTSLTDDAVKWQFFQLRPATGYVAAVCVERRPGISVKVSLRRITPLGDDTLMSGILLRHSRGVERVLVT